MALEDKESRDDSVRVFRKSFTVAFYELYEEVFIHYAKKGEKHRLVELFLNYGLLDERLLTDAQLEFLGSIPPIVRTEPCKVYRMKDWLMRVYKGEEIPSKNEFDMEYVDYVRDRKKKLELMLNLYVRASHFITCENQCDSDLLGKHRYRSIKVGK